MDEYLRNITFKSTEAVHPAASTNADKPPMSTGKRTVNSKTSSLKTVQSVHHSPAKALPDSKLTNASPSNNLATTPLTFALQPMDNPPTIEPSMPLMKTVSKTDLADEDPPIPPLPEESTKN